VFFYTDGHGVEEKEAVIDTVYIEPELGHYTVIWRASRPLKKSVFEIVQVVVGKKPVADTLRADCLNATREDFERAMLEDDDEEDDFM
jgi:hypothetical protein